jgi:uncharacterized protein YjdB
MPRPKASLLLAAIVVLSITCSDGPTPPQGPDRTPVSLSVSHDSLVLEVGDSAQAWAEVRDAQNTLVVPSVTWSSTDATVATVETGKVRALVAGTAYVKGTQGALADSLRVRVLPVITETNVASLADTLTALGHRTTLTANSLAGADGREGRYTFTVSDPAVLVLEEQRTWGTATVRATGPGESWIHVTERGGTKDSVLVTVKPAPFTLAFPAETQEGFLDRSITPAITALDENGNTIVSPQATLRVADTTIARVTNGNSLQLLKVGYSRLDAIGPSGSKATSEIIVRPYPALSAVVTSDGFLWPVVRLGTGQIAEGTISGGPLHTNVINVAVTGDPALSATAGVGAPLVLTGLQAGRSKVIVSSPLMTPDTLEVEVTRSRLTQQGLPLTALGVGESGYLTVRASDSLGNWRPYTADIPVAVESSDSTIVSVAPASRSITLNRLSNNFIGVQVQGVAAGTATVTLSSPGFVSMSTEITVASLPALILTPMRTIFGAGQRADHNFINNGSAWLVSASDRGDVTVTLSHSHPSVATAPATVTLTNLDLAQWFVVDALQPGLDTVIASAPGYRPDTAVVTVTSPRFFPLGLAPSMPVNAIGAVQLGVGDTTGARHLNLAEVGVRAQSSDSAKIVPQGATIPALWRNEPWPIQLIMKDTGLVDVTLTDSAGNLPPMVVPVRGVLNPGLNVAANENYELATVGVGQNIPTTVYVGVEIPVEIGAREIAIGSSNTAVLPAAGTVMLTPANLPIEAQIPPPIGVGTAHIVVSGTNYVTDSSIAIQVGVPRLQFTRASAKVSAGQVDTVRVRLTDQRGRPRTSSVPVIYRVRVAGGSGPATEPILDTIPAGTNQGDKIPLIHARFGSVLVIAEDAGTAIAVPYAADTVPVLVPGTGPSLSFGSDVVTIGAGLRRDIPVARVGSSGEALTPTVSAKRSLVSPLGGFSFAMNSGSQALTLRGTSLGVDTVIVGASGYSSDTLRVVVSEPRLQLLGVPSSPKVGTSFTVTVRITDSDNVTGTVVESTTISLASSDGFTPTNSEGAAIKSVTIPAGASEATFMVKPTASGSQTLVASRLDARPAQVSVTVAP